MKKISLFVLSVLTVAAVQAQSTTLGIKGGLNISSLTIKPDDVDQGNKAGIHAGLLAHVHLSPNWALQPELLYSSQGSKYMGVEGREHSLSLNYVNIPVLAQYMFSNGFRLETGPQIGILADVNDKVGGAETGTFSTDDYKSVDISWGVGLGYLSSSNLGVDARYNFGLSNVNDFGTRTIRNNVFQVGLFYQFNNSSRR